MHFCTECSIEHLGKDFSDFAGIISQEQVDEGYGVLVHCDGCGDIYVDREGTRIRHATEEEIYTIHEKSTSIE